MAMANATDGSMGGAGLGADSLVLSSLLAFFVVNLVGQMTVFSMTSVLEYKRRETGKKDAAPADMSWQEQGGQSVLKPVESPIIAKKRKENGGRTVTWAETKEHSSKEDCWVVLDGKVYDVTSFVDRHPGGWRPMVHGSENDKTEAFNEFHPAAVAEKWLPQFYIADVADYEVSELVRDYRAIRQEFLARDLFENTSTYYTAKMVWLVSIFAPTVYGAMACSSTFAHMASACGMALFWQQLAFVGHDVGHNSVSHRRETDLFYGGLFGNALGAIGLSWWKLSHNTHHVVCNSIEHDPDIQHQPFLVVAEKIFGRFYSTFHERFFTTNAAVRFLVSYQHFLFYPFMAFARFNLIIQSFLVLFSKEPCQYRAMEFCSLASFWLWFGALLNALPTPQERLAYVIVSFALSGVLHVQITISHFSMDVFNGNSPDDWIRHQLATTMDVSCPTWLDWFHGGLQFQVQHHLWPRLPRAHLRLARERLLALAAKHELKYVEMDFIAANKRLIGQLYKTALVARTLEKGDAGFYHSQLWDGINAQG